MLSWYIFWNFYQLECFYSLTILSSSNNKTYKIRCNYALTFKSFCNDIFHNFILIVKKLCYKFLRFTQFLSLNCVSERKQKRGKRSLIYIGLNLAECWKYQNNPAIAIYMRIIFACRKSVFAMLKISRFKFASTQAPKYWFSSQNYELNIVLYQNYCTKSYLNFLSLLFSSLLFGWNARNNLHCL